MALVKITEMAAATYAAATDILELVQGATNKNLEARVLRGQKVTALTSSSGVVNIDLSLGNYFTLALSENITSITFSNTPGAGFGQTVMLRITQNASAKTVAWPASFKWESGSAGAVSTGSGAIDILALTTFDNGTAWQATLSKGRA